MKNRLLLPAIVAFAVTVGISAYLFLSPRISADTTATTNSLTMTISLTNWWGDPSTPSSANTNDQAVYMQYVKDQKYRCSTTQISIANAVGNSTDSDQTKVSNNRQAVWAAAYDIALASGLTTYNGTQQFINVTKSMNSGITDPQIEAKLKELVNINSSSYRCQGNGSVAYGKTLVVPAKYQVTTNTSNIEEKTVTIKVADKDGKPAAGAEAVTSIALTGRYIDEPCTTDSNGQCVVHIKNDTGEIKSSTMLSFNAIVNNPTRYLTPIVEKSWGELKDGDIINLSATVASDVSDTKSITFKVNSSAAGENNTTSTAGAVVYSRGTDRLVSSPVDQVCNVGADGTCKILVSLKSASNTLDASIANFQFEAKLNDKKSALVTKKWTDLKDGDTVSLDLNLSAGTAVTPLTAADGTPSPFVAPTTNSKTAIIKVRNARTKRILGGASVEIQGTTVETDKVAMITTNPPLPEGEQIAGFQKGSYSIIVKRTGYEIFEKTINLSANEKYFNVDVAMTPIAGLPNPDLQFNNLALNSLNASNQLGAGGTNNALINALLQALGQGTNASTLGNFPYQSGFSPNLAQTASVPLQLAVVPQYPFNQFNTTIRFEVIESLTNRSVLSTTFSLGPLNNNSATNLIRTACLNPNSQYYLKVSIPNNNSLIIQPYLFTSGSYGQATTLTVPIGQNNILNGGDLSSSVIYNNVDRSTLITNIQNCPSTTLSSAMLGQNTWTGQTVTDTQIRSYVVVAYTDGRYYLVNPLLVTDVRLIQFVPSQNSTGGLAFVSAATGLNINSMSQSGWYITTYTLIDNKPVIDKTKLSRVDISPDDYRRTINSEIVENFN